MIWRQLDCLKLNLQFYAKAMKIGAVKRFEHRVVVCLTMTGMVVESTILIV